MGRPRLSVHICLGFAPLLVDCRPRTLSMSPSPLECLYHSHTGPLPRVFPRRAFEPAAPSEMEFFGFANCYKQLQTFHTFWPLLKCAILSMRESSWKEAVSVKTGGGTRTPVLETGMLQV